MGVRDMRRLASSAVALLILWSLVLGLVSTGSEASVTYCILWPDHHVIVVRPMVILLAVVATGSLVMLWLETRSYRVARRKALQ